MMGRNFLMGELDFSYMAKSEAASYSRSCASGTNEISFGGSARYLVRVGVRG